MAKQMVDSKGRACERISWEYALAIGLLGIVCIGHAVTAYCKVLGYADRRGYTSSFWEPYWPADGFYQGVTVFAIAATVIGLLMIAAVALSWFGVPIIVRYPDQDKAE